MSFYSTIKHYKVSSILNIAGMAVAFAAFYIILTQVSWNFGYNKGIKDSDRVFLMSTPGFASSTTDDPFTPFLPRPVGTRMAEAGTGVESYGIRQTLDIDDVYLFSKEGDNIKRVPLSGAWRIDPGAVSTLGIETVEGDITKLFSGSSMAITQSLASKYDVHVGEVFSLYTLYLSGDMEIVAIIKDGPANSDFRTAQALFAVPESENIDSYQNWQYPFFVKLEHASDKEAFEESVKPILKDIYSDKGDDRECHLLAIGDLYYDKSMDRSVTLVGNKTSDISLLAIGILILLVALFNYVNFFFALVPARIRSVNTHKILGKSRAGLVGGFLLETVGFVLISLAIAAVLVILFKRSTAMAFLNASVDFAMNVRLVLLTVLIALVTCVAGSVYPALYITKFEPALALKPGFSAIGPGKTLRTALLAFQFIVSMILIICSSFIMLQRNYLLKYDLGFDREQLITGMVNSTVAHYGSSADAFADRLRSDPRIVDVAWSDGDVISKDRMGWGRDYRGETIYFECFPVSYNFLDVLGIKVTEGRNFRESDERSTTGVIILNEDARKTYDMDFTTPLSGHDGNCEVAGFCNDFLFRPVQYGISPFAFYVFGANSWRDRLTQIYVRTEAGANPFEVIEFIKKTIAELDPEADVETINLNLFDKAVERYYQEEKKTGGFLVLFTCIAILLSLMGVFGIVLFDTQHRKREIAIRRVLGAEIPDILSIFNKFYIIMIMICFVCAALAAFFIVKNYFSHFAYHMAINWWVFAATLAIVLIVTVAIVSLRSFRSAMDNPVDSLKQE